MIATLIVTALVHGNATLNVIRTVDRAHSGPRGPCDRAHRVIARTAARAYRLTAKRCERASRARRAYPKRKNARR